MRNLTSKLGLGLGLVLFYLYWGISWIVNLIKFIKCDFDGPWKEEIIHGVGVFFALPSVVTVWF